jgi:hypothetical protein
MLSCLTFIRPLAPSTFDLVNSYITPPKALVRPSLYYKSMRQIIQSVWDECDRGNPPIGMHDDNGWWFHCPGMAKKWGTGVREAPEGRDTVFLDHKRQSRTTKYCRGLFEIVQQSPYHLFQVLDNTFSSLIQFGLDTNETGEVIVERAYHILSRLPVEPLSLEKANPELFHRYIIYVPSSISSTS